MLPPPRNEFYLVTQMHGYTMRLFIDSWGRDCASRITVLPYENLIWSDMLKPGTYIFSDIERLTDKERGTAAKVWDELSRAGTGVRLLNHPMRSIGRYELLRTLDERGFNQFTVYRATERQTVKQFPLFLRGENDHSGSLTPLLQTPDDLDAAITKTARRGQARQSRLIVEFCDTSDVSGVFRKYSAFIVGERIIPRHIFFSRNWMVKLPDLICESKVSEELRYLEDNPHESDLREVFRLAQINYGRIDYGMLNGKPQIWEINTNPMLAGHVSSTTPERKRVHVHFLQQLTSAFEAIDCEADSHTEIPAPVKTRISEITGAAAPKKVARVIIRSLWQIYYVVAYRVLPRFDVLYRAAKFIQRLYEGWGYR
jgi:hypothetical protein